MFKGSDDKSLEYVRKINTPTCIFLTFETEQGYDTACQYNKLINQVYENMETSESSEKEAIIFKMNEYNQFLGGSIEILPAEETSDIIWENFYYTYKYKTSRFCYRMGIRMIIVLILIVSAVSIYWMQKLSHAYVDRFPECTNVKLFEDKFDISSDEFSKSIDLIKVEYEYESKKTNIYE